MDRLHQVQFSIYQPKPLSTGLQTPPISESGETEIESDADYVTEKLYLQKQLLNLCPAHIWHENSYLSGCPRPVVIQEHHQHQLSALNEALVIAITDIVERWFSDTDAAFPSRMPLTAKEEGTLRWLYSQVASGNCRPYAECRGSWRPDFLVDVQNNKETYVITEINARFAFNAYMHGSYGQAALEDSSMVQLHNLKSATSASGLIQGLLSLFNPDLPLHLLKGVEKGIDIHMFQHYLETQLGIRPRLITPSDLRLRPDPTSTTGYKLCCVVRNDEAAEKDEESFEDISQVGLELHQHELVALDDEILRHLSLSCFNDLRTILLVHDKRMLGIVKQELGNLVASKTLTPSQALVLQHGIADTILPASKDLSNLLDLCQLKPSTRHEFLIKPVRGGKGAGIQFGDETSIDEWQKILQSQTCVDIESQPVFVVQRLVEPNLYEVDIGSGSRRYPLVGTYHVVHGKLLGLGTWRSNGERICAVSRGGAFICSVIDAGLEM